MTDAVWLLPTPVVADADRTSETYARGNPTLAGALLPTPIARDGRGTSPGITNPAGRPLDEVVGLLPTPTTRDHHGAGGHGTGGDNLRTVVAGALLPTPRATDGTKGGPNQHGSSGDLMLSSAVQPGRLGRYAAALLHGPEGLMGYLDHEQLGPARPGEVLPEMPNAPDAEAIQRPPRRSEGVPAPTVLFPELREHPGRGDEGCTPLAGAETPEVGLRGVRGDDGPACASQRQESEEQRSGQPDNPVLLVPSEVPLAGRPGGATGGCETRSGYGCGAWGRYAPAVHRWEMVLGRIAPPATELSPKGSRRLSPLAVEWLMGADTGTVTAVPGVSRAGQLARLGNGVVRQQATAAVLLLLDGAA